MAVFTVGVTTYQVQIRAFSTDVSAVITVTGMSGTTTVKANVYFVKAGKAIPAATSNNTGPVYVESYQPEAAYMSWVDLLRNEKPLTMNINGSNFYVQTGQEAAGAAEIGS